MLSSDVKPYANSIWNWGKIQQGANLIDIDSKTLMLTLLPRTEGKFTRFGLKVNKLRYTNETCAEWLLKGGNVTVSYNPDDVSKVWIKDDGKYVEFYLIETQFKDNTLDEIEEIRDKQNTIIKQAEEENMQAKIYLAGYIETIAQGAVKNNDVYLKNIRITKSKERVKNHIDYMKEGVIVE